MVYFVKRLSPGPNWQWHGGSDVSQFCELDIANKLILYIANNIMFPIIGLKSAIWPWGEPRENYKEWETLETRTKYEVEKLKSLVGVGWEWREIRRRMRLDSSLLGAMNWVMLETEEEGPRMARTPPIMAVNKESPVNEESSRILRLDLSLHSQCPPQ